MWINVLLKVANFKARASSEVRSDCLRHIQLGFEYLQRWSLHNLSGQSVTRFDHPHRGGEEIQIYGHSCVCKLYLLLVSWLTLCAPKQSCMYVILSFLWSTSAPHFHNLSFWKSLYPFTRVLQAHELSSCQWGEIMGWSHGVSVGRKVEKSDLIMTGSFWDVHVHILLPFVFLSIFPGSFWPKTEMVLCALLLTCLGLKVRQDSESACPLWMLWGE